MNITFCNYKTTKSKECDKSWVFSYYGTLRGETLCNARVLEDSCPFCNGKICSLSRDKQEIDHRMRAIGGLILIEEEPIEL